MRYPCPCCGHLVFDWPPASYFICPVCFWEDDAVRLDHPDFAGGANKTSLLESQKNFAAFGAMDVQLLDYVRPPNEDEPLEEGWRPIDLSQDRFDPLGTDKHDLGGDLTLLYYWRPTFWRRR